MAVIMIILSTLGCNGSSHVARPKEIPVLPIELSGEIAARIAELSGLGWYNDYLILLPQYPSRFSENGATGALFYIPKEEIREFLEGKRDVILPGKIEIHYEGVTDEISGFEGFESISFSGNRVFMTIEASGIGMMGYLIKGEITEDLTRIDLDPALITPIPPQSDIDNASDETMLILNDKIYTVYEGNGGNVNPHPVAHVFDLELNPIEEIPFPGIEYRVTDATRPGEDGSFWVINYFWPGDTAAYHPAPDLLVEQYGTGETHSRFQSVERLVKMKVTQSGITLSDTAPIPLKLIGDDDSRNWEGIAQFDTEGFLICTDYYPGTILGFVKFTAE